MGNSGLDRQAPPAFDRKNPAAGRTHARRQAFLDAAAALFLAQGYERTSLTEIVARSGGSRSTLYDLFGGKDGLLRAMIDESIDQVWQATSLNDESQPLTPETLEQLALSFVHTVLSPRNLAVYRVVISEAHRVPDIAALFLQRGPCVTQARLAERFRRTPWAERDDITPEKLSGIFFGAVLGPLHFHHAIGLPPYPPDQIDTQVKAAVHLFVRGLMQA